MKLISFILILSISLSLSKKSKKQKKYQSSSDSASESDDGLAHSGEVNLGPKRFEVKSSGLQYFNCKGTLRKTFALELSYQNSGGNVVCSPVSALLPLCKLILGAEGRTRAELTDAIGEYKKSALNASMTALIKKLQFIPGVKLDVASRIYVGEDTEILPKFANSSKAIFQSTIEKISFKEPKQAADEINGWVSRQTNGMIPLLLQPSQIAPSTSMIIVNAVYFKGKWEKPFRNINVGEFYAPSGPKKIQLMTQETTCRYTKSNILNAEIVEIPYNGSEANFVIVLPIERSGLQLLLNQLKLAPKLLNNALKTLKKTSLQLTIPKFSISTSFDLKEMYEKIGLNEMMSPQSGLKNIVKDNELKISSAIQKAVIEVHETGTEAAAASAVHLMAMSAMMPKVKFRANHPFLFYIEAHSEQIFAGIYSEP